MKVEIYGKKSGSFTDTNGKEVNYGKIYCLADFPASTSDKVEGQQALIISVSPQALCNIPIPCNADLQFDNYGRLQSVDVL